MCLSVYVLRAVDMHLIKGNLLTYLLTFTYLLTYLIRLLTHLRKSLR